MDSDSGGLETDPDNGTEIPGNANKSARNTKVDNTATPNAEQPPIPANKKDDEPNMSDVETPRVDVSGMKLDSAQKEKNSFLQELKK